MKETPAAGASTAPRRDGRSPVDRRRFLGLAAACATTLWVPRSAWCEPRLVGDPFALGVASGSPTHDSVVLWTRLASGAHVGSTLSGNPVTVRWEIAHDDRFAHIVQRGQSVAPVELGHSVHVEVAGLEPDRWYFYRFMSGDAQSPVGRTRTFPAPGAAATRLRIAFASCQRWDHGYFGAYRHMRDDNPDVVLFLGDYIYECLPVAAPVRVPMDGALCTLDDYRRQYAFHKSDPDLQAMHAACPWLVTWDDHEVENDYAGPRRNDGGAPAPDFAARCAAAYQAYYEHMPLRASVLTRALAGLEEGAEMRIYSSVRFGTLASLHLLDDRQYRDPQVCGGDRTASRNVHPEECIDWEDPKRTLLGPAQERWLDEAFARGSSGWNVVGMQTLFGQRDFKPGSGHAFWNDGWDGYPAARKRMLASIRRHSLANPVVLGGDVHQNWVGHVKADYANPSSHSIGVEFCGTSITSRSDRGGKLRVRLAENPHFIFADATHRGYGIAEFTPKRLTTSLRVVSDVARRDTRIETLARFSVEAGRSVIVAE